MSIGMIALIVVSILVLFGVGQRVLDRMGLTDRGAILFMGAILLGSLIPDIYFTPNFAINIGGALIPFILVIYLFVKADSTVERVRAVAGAILAGAGVYLAGRFLPAEPELMWMDPNYSYGIIAAIVGYILGRSRRGAFISGVMGVLLGDLAVGIVNAATGTPTVIRLGGAGAMDAVVISGFLAVLLAEIFGELRERLQGGTSKKKEELRNIEKERK